MRKNIDLKGISRSIGNLLVKAREKTADQYKEDAKGTKAKKMPLIIANIGIAAALAALMVVMIHTGL